MHRALGRASRQLTELAASEGRFRDLTELSADWFWETDAEHRITWISAGGSVATLFGNKPTFGKRFWEIPRVEVEPRALEAHLQRLGEQLPFFDLEIQRTDERGARLIHIISGRSRVTPRGEFLGYRGVGRDVTEQRRAERAVFEAKERVELALDGGNLAEWHFDVEHDTLYAGDGWVRFLGHGRSPAVGKGAMLYDMMHPEDRERSRASMARALKGELEEYVDEFRVPTRAGEWKWLQARGRVVERDAEGRALRVSGTIADIDSRKRAETALQEAEARYRSLVDLAPNGVLVHSAGVIEYANPAAARLLKAESPAQLIGTQLEALFNPADLPRVRERQSVLLAAPAAVGFEERRMRCLDGTELIVEGAAVSFLERGRMVVQGVLRDVTEERQARQALAEREQRFRDVVHASGEYVWETDAHWRYTYLSERVEAVLGYARNELLGRAPHEFMPLGEAHFPDTQAPFRDVVRRSITKSGGVIWQSVSGVPRRAVRSAEPRPADRPRRAGDPHRGAQPRPARGALRRPRSFQAGERLARPPGGRRAAARGRRPAAEHAWPRGHAGTAGRRRLRAAVERPEVGRGRGRARAAHPLDPGAAVHDRGQRAQRRRLDRHQHLPERRPRFRRAAQECRCGALRREGERRGHLAPVRPGAQRARGGAPAHRERAARRAGEERAGA